MNDMDSNEYFEKKKALLKECVSLSEEMLSNISKIDTIKSILVRRSEKIRLLQDLEVSCGKAMGDSLSEKQKAQINQVVSLLLALDRDTSKKIRTEQVNLKILMKVNTQNHKLMGYTGKYAPTRGRLLDCKK